ncbi:MAG: hypothetical protein WCV50_03010 [Patescibacteria group bacterium]
MIKKLATEISAEDLRGKVMNASRSWHHHCLSANCFFNDTDREVIVLEAGDDIFYCPSTQDLREELEEHAYQMTNPRKVKGRPQKHEALELVKKYARAGEKWHFHITMPHCLLSMEDNYVLIVENDQTKDLQKWEFEEKPTVLVRAIDDYYLGRKK